MMAVLMAVVILAASLAALLQFFSIYCRSLIAASVTQPLSSEIQDVTGIKAGTAGPEDFPRVVQLLQLCPDFANDRRKLSAIRAYFRLMSAVRWSLASFLPEVRTWTEAQLSQCAYFAAVALDHRVSRSRTALAAHMHDSQ